MVGFGDTDMLHLGKKAYRSYGVNSQEYRTLCSWIIMNLKKGVDSINATVEGDIDMRGISGLSNNTRPGAQEFRVKMKITSDTASKEQIDKLYETEENFHLRSIH
jgi:hypothetical protein